jgi:sugar phosphate isomerase/epimerase
MNIAFNTANLIGRSSGYRFELNRWGEYHKRTVEATDEAAWYAICQEIAETGFKAIEIWEAHASPETMTEARASLWLQILEDHGLQPIGYAGSFRPETVDVCRWLDLPMVNGSTTLIPAEASALASHSGVRFNLENHPQKSAAQILEAIDGGNEWLGVCIDTGWLGTQGVNAPTVIRDCGEFVRHVHCKDVIESGAHETCLLGTGEVDLIGCLEALRDWEYRGWYSWEDEPENRNPMDSAVENRHWLESHIAP